MCFMYIDRIYFSDSGTKISMNDIIVKAAGYSLKVKKKWKKSVFKKNVYVIAYQYTENTIVNSNLFCFI